MVVMSTPDQRHETECCFIELERSLYLLLMYGTYGRGGGRLSRSIWHQALLQQGIEVE